MRALHITSSVLIFILAILHYMYINNPAGKVTRCFMISNYAPCPLNGGYDGILAAG